MNKYYKKYSEIGDIYNSYERDERIKIRMHTLAEAIREIELTKDTIRKAYKRQMRELTERQDRLVKYIDDDLKELGLNETNNKDGE